MADASIVQVNLSWALVALAVFVAIFLFVKNREGKMKFEQRVRDHIEEHEAAVRKDAISRSARTLSGKALEKMVPFLERFGHDPHDVRWIGDPVDLVVFDGYSANGRKKVDGVTFVEVKSGDSELSDGQRRIRDAVRRGNVRWEEFRA